jgi:fructose-bisphosphate aldolase class I
MNSLLLDICGPFGEEMDKNIKFLTQKGKGLLACDEWNSLLGDHFANYGIPNSEENRRDYREMLFKSGFEKYVSGAILYEETLFQKSSSGEPMVDLLHKVGVIPGIQVDLNLKPLFGPNSNEFITQGLDNLDERAARYYKAGARFAKWRAVFAAKPSHTAVSQNAQALARYASICQSQGLIPIVEPEVLVLDGDHSIETSLQTSRIVFSTVFAELNAQNVVLSRIILKPSMVLPGRNHPNQATPEQVAKATMECLMSTVPPMVRAAMFLSGGQTEEEAAIHLNEMNKLKLTTGWNLSFSYGRALQETARKKWAGKQENNKIAQEAFLEVCEKCSLACYGEMDKKRKNQEDGDQERKKKKF